MSTRNTLFVAVAVLLLAAGTCPAQSADKAIGYLTRALEAVRSASDYTATYLRQEANGFERSPEETIQFKFRKPFAVYMKWTRDPNKGREVLFVKGKNDNKIIAHEGGLLSRITVAVDPGKTGDKGSIMDAGIERFLESTLADVRRAQRAGELKVKEMGRQTVCGRATDAVEFQFPRGRGYDNSRLAICFDTQNHLPIQWTAYDSRGRFSERSVYRDLKLNTGLTEADFDRKNPAYRFR